MKEALDKRNKVYGPNAYQSVSTTYFYARVKEDCELYDEALQIYVNLIEQEKQTQFGRNNPATLHHYALCLKQTGKLQEAIEMGKVAYESNLRLYGADDAETIEMDKSWNN